MLQGGGWARTRAWGGEAESMTDREMLTSNSLFAFSLSLSLSH